MSDRTKLQLWRLQIAVSTGLNLNFSQHRGVAVVAARIAGSFSKVSDKGVASWSKLRRTARAARPRLIEGLSTAVVARSFPACCIVMFLDS